MRHFWTMLLVVAVALVMALPVGAAPPKCDEPGGENLPGCAPKDEDPPITAKSIAVYMDAEPMWVHEGADIVKYNVSLQNKTDTDIEEQITVKFKFEAAFSTETVTEIVDGIPANKSEAVGFSRSVESFPEAEQCLLFVEDACDLIASVEVYIGTELVADETMSTPLYPDPPCSFNDAGVALVDGICIWTLPMTIDEAEYGTGVWQITLTPTAPANKPNRPIGASVSVRDGVPGNWCTLAIGTSSTFGGRWKAGDADIVGSVYLPGDENLPTEQGDEGYPTLGLDEGMCLGGGAGGNYFKVGNPKSFYLATNGTVTVEWTSETP